MSMNNANYGYPSTGFSPTISSLYASTPTTVRTQRPNRFGFSGPSPYPRPRSSASKPNPDSFSDSMINNYGNSASRMDISFPSENANSFNSSYRTQTSNSSYYSCNDSYYPEQSYPGRENENIGYQHDSAQPFSQPYTQPKYFYDNNTLLGLNDGGEIKGQFQKKFPQDYQPAPTYQQRLASAPSKIKFQPRTFNRAKRNMSERPPTQIRCELCKLDFTSQIPYDMHIRGAKHAKKMKAKATMQSIQNELKEIQAQGNQFKCEICNVIANSSLQLQTHLTGNKHKTKLQQLQQPKTDEKPESVEKPETVTQVNGKSNGAVVRPLPSDFGEPQPAKLAKFSCDICSLIMNSEIQLQQHLTSKKHQAKVEGKPIVKARKNKTKEGNVDTNTEDSNASAPSDTVQDSSETSKTVMGVKTLTSSFVQGGTLQ